MQYQSCEKIRNSATSKSVSEGEITLMPVAAQTRPSVAGKEGANEVAEGGSWLAGCASLAYASGYDRLRPHRLTVSDRSSPRRAEEIASVTSTECRLPIA
jgi:hypothetical protein